MNLALGISTMNDGVYRALKNIEFKPVIIPVFIVHQVTNNLSYDVNIEALKEKNIFIVIDYNSGLSRSRNLLLKTAMRNHAEHLIISDDDVTYLWEKFREIEEGISKFPEAHIQLISLTERGGEQRKRYNEGIKYLSKRELFKVSSIEMCVNLKQIQKNEVLFDENFGLGSKYPVGEEAVFLTDLYVNGDKVVFIPIPFTCHPIESTGIRLFTERNMIYSRGALISRCYGLRFGIILVFIFWAKKFIFIRKVEGHVSKYISLKEMIRGFYGIH